MPRVTATTVARLVDAAGRPGQAAGAVLVDGAGVRQTLAGAYRRTALLAARPTDRTAESGLSVRRLLSGLTLLEVPAVADEARDVDTWQDLRALAE
jgi:CTP:molybdopterin cytidylyltransferase MocA